MDTSMLEVKNLSFSYGRRKAKVLEDFSLTLQKGSVYGLLGKNGTGKSTLLYLMAGLLRPQQGNVMYKGMDIYFCLFILCLYPSVHYELYQRRGGCISFSILLAGLPIMLGTRLAPIHSC